VTRANSREVDIIVPQVGEAIAEATLVRWLKNEGDAVRRGEVLFEVDLDKATVEVEAFEDGTIGSILVPEDSPVVPLQKVAVLLLPGHEGTEPVTAPPGSEDSGSSSAASEESGLAAATWPMGRPSPDAPASPRARRLAQELGVSLSEVAPTGEEGMITAADVERAAALGDSDSGDGTRPADEADAS
jgi:pyruvate/2-oxoglutarate dehydrogenase complex dihydrolipoamide acyltransferase (E2) component